MFEFGDIVCVAFPFTDLSATKLRPALVVSRGNEHRRDIVLAFITSRPTAEKMPGTMRIEPNKDNGLRTVSYVRFDKLVTLDKKLIQGTLGQAGRSWLQSAKSVFFGVFGF